MSPLRGGLSLAMRPKKTVAKKPLSESDEPPSVVAEVFKSIDDDQKMRETRFFRPSGIGGCLREGYYHYLKTVKKPERLPARIQLVFDQGSSIHEIVQKWLGKSQRFFSAHEVNVWVPTLEVFGHVDTVMIEMASMYAFMVEVKSINSDGFNRIARPKSEHRAQANLYLGLLRRLAPWLQPWFVVLYYNKDNQSLREFKCRFNQKLFEKSMAWCAEIKEYIDNNDIPPYDPRRCDEQICRYVDICKKNMKGRK